VTLDYIDRMDLAYAAADLAVSRAGAMTCAELAAVGLPAVYVPLPVGNGEQALNATPVVSAGGGLLVDDAAFTPEVVEGTVLALLTDADRLAAMGRAATTYGIRDGSERLAQLVQEAVGAR
jgi:UDP-N-acetylglucosamine--N-acetylmuramyl-(pentapeptide) pyrophosphoryl-undecaprenol N-acetylglucosamine transferase